MFETTDEVQHSRRFSRGRHHIDGACAPKTLHGLVDPALGALCITFKKFTRGTKHLGQAIDTITLALRETTGLDASLHRCRGDIDGFGKGLFIQTRNTGQVRIDLVRQSVFESAMKAWASRRNTECLPYITRRFVCGFKNSNVSHSGTSHVIEFNYIA